MIEPLKILVVTTLYPHAGAPTHGVFVENRMAAYRDWSGAEIRVVAPVPWFPFTHDAFGDWARAARAPLRETRRGLSVEHPRYLLPPKVGMRFAPHSLFAAILAAARAAIASGFDFDILDAHYLYPDGVAAAKAARVLGKPFVLTARGSDVTYFPKHKTLKRAIVDSVAKADAVIAVADALRTDLEAIGAPRGKALVLRNGVDLEMFRQHDMAGGRAALGFGADEKIALSVGHLIDRKGHDIAIRAIAGNPGARLLIAGDGPEKKALERLAGSLQCADRVHFLGRIGHAQLAPIYSAADALILASTREGWPNVLLEAMACGARVVASDAGGISEVVAAPEAGEVVRERSGEAFAAALSRAFEHKDRAAVRRYAERFSWDETSARLDAIFNDIREKQRARARARISRPIPRSPQKPQLIFTIDTEEEFDWSRYGAGQGRAGTTEGVARLQALCEEKGAKPLYFLTHPLLVDETNATFFRKLAREGRADAGLHLHGWETPPYDVDCGEYGSWQTNLPYALHRAKLHALAAEFKRVFGTPARAHRAGRYGLALQDYELLAEIGVTHDFSPSPGFDFSARGGPDFSSMTNHSFDVDTLKGKVRVTPVSGALAFRGSSRFRPQPGVASFEEADATRRAGTLYAPMRITCEQTKFEELCALTRAILKDGAPVLTFSLHSTSLAPGGNPYAATEAEIEDMLGLIRRYFDFFADEIGGEFVELADLSGGSKDDVMLNPPLRATS